MPEFQLNMGACEEEANGRGDDFRDTMLMQGHESPPIDPSPPLKRGRKTIRKEIPLLRRHSGPASEAIVTALPYPHHLYFAPHPTCYKTTHIVRADKSRSTCRYHLSDCTGGCQVPIYGYKSYSGTQPSHALRTHRVRIL